jgi:hypothetical protein
VQVIGNVFLIDCAQNKHLIGSVAAICAAYSADKAKYRLRESLSVVNFSSGPNRPVKAAGPWLVGPSPAFWQAPPLVLPSAANLDQI